MDFTFKQSTEKYSFTDLVKIVELLRAPGGCPWDREQTHDSIKRNLVEEGYELIEAIDGGKPEKIADESGDLLLQVVFHAVMGKESGEYEMDDVTDAICRKLIHRHPHVFGDTEVSGSGEVLKNWDAIKRADRGQAKIADELRGVSKYLPALMRAEKIQKKAEKAGYTDPCCAESEDALTDGRCGEMLFDMVYKCRKCGVDPELALAGYTEKFIKDFEIFEKEEQGK